MKASELTLTDIIQNEFRLTLEDDDTNFALEDLNNSHSRKHERNYKYKYFKFIWKKWNHQWSNIRCIGIVDRDMTLLIL